jgi:hypothetical protein
MELVYRGSIRDVANSALEKQSAEIQRAEAATTA